MRSAVFCAAHPALSQWTASCAGARRASFDVSLDVSVTRQFLSARPLAESGRSMPSIAKETGRQMHLA
jgi:hypothetical protein